MMRGRAEQERGVFSSPAGMRLAAVPEEQRLLLHSGCRGAWVERHYAYFIMCPCITPPNMETIFIQRLFRNRNERAVLSTVP